MLTAPASIAVLFAESNTKEFDQALTQTYDARDADEEGNKDGATTGSVRFSGARSVMREEHADRNEQFAENLGV